MSRETGFSARVRWALLAALLLAPPAAGLEFDPARMWRVEDLRPGMRGEARTVFQGDSVETFQVEVLGVVRGFSSDGDLVLVQAHGDKVEHTGIAAGMSGSPVTIEGRLVGAIALGWSFSKDPVAGVTPIAQMIRSTEIPDSTRRLELEPRRMRGESRGAPLPLLCGLQGRSGNPSALADTFLAGVFPGQEWNFLAGPVPGRPGTGRPRPAAALSGHARSLEGGDAMGVSLVEGDLELSAVGTVTLVQGAEVLCFGHPLFTLGSVSMPLTRARIHTVLASGLSSQKMASLEESVGTLVEDRNYAVRGRLGGVADMLPVALEVAGEDGRSRVFHYRIMRHHALMAQLAGLAIADGLTDMVGGLPRVAVPYQATIHFQGNRRLDWQDQPVSNAGSQPGTDVARDVATRLQLLLNNSWQWSRLDSVVVTARVEPGNRMVFLESAWLLDGRPMAGQPLHVAVRLRPEQGELRVETLSLDLPAHMPAGRYRIVVGDVDAAQEAERQRAPGALRASSLDQAVQLLNARKPHNTLVATLYSDDTGLSTRGQELPGLPGSALALMDAGRPGGLVQSVKARRWVEAARILDFTLTGAVELTFNLESEEP